MESQNVNALDLRGKCISAGLLPSPTYPLRLWGTNSFLLFLIFMNNQLYNIKLCTLKIPYINFHAKHNMSQKSFLQSTYPCSRPYSFSWQISSRASKATFVKAGRLEGFWTWTTPCARYSPVSQKQVVPRELFFWLFSSARAQISLQ